MMPHPVAPIAHRWIPALLCVVLAGCATTTATTVDPHAAARAAFQEGRLTHVIALLEPLATQGQASAQEMHMLSDAHLRRGDGGAALAVLEAVRPLEAPEAEANTLRKMGAAAALAGEYPLAIAHLRQANARAPQPESLRLLTRLLIGNDAIPEAIEAGQAAIRMDLDNPEGFVLLATAFALDGVRSQALTAARRAESLGASGAETLVALGNIHLAFDRLPDAIERYERAVALAPSHVEAYQKLGLAKTLLGDSAGAVQALQRARTLAPDNIEVLNNLGIALSDLHLHREAADAYGEAHRLAPDATVLIFNQADALALDGRPLEAKALLQSFAFPPKEGPRAAELSQRMERIAQAATAACAAAPTDALQKDKALPSPLEDRILRATIARCR